MVETINIKDRLSVHLNDLKNNRAVNSNFQREYNQYGKDSFEFIRSFTSKRFLLVWTKIENNFLPRW